MAKERKEIMRETSNERKKAVIAYCIFGLALLIYIFVQSDVKFFSRSSGYDSSIHTAVINGDTAKVQKLIADAHVALDESGSQGLTPVGLAMAYNKLSILELLLKQGNRSQEKYGTSDVYTVLFDMLNKEKNLSPLLQILKKYPSFFDAQTAIVKAVELENTSILFEIIKNFPEINIQKVYTEGGDSLLILALEQKDANLLHALLAKNIDIHGKTAHGWTPLMVAAWAQNTEGVRQLLARGAEVDAKNEEGFTALNHAVMHGNLEIVKLLIQAKATINHHGNDGETPLMVATLTQNIAHVRLLLEHGAAVNAKNNDGLTALHHAVIQNNIEIAALLVQAKANVNQQDKDGWTPLTWAEHEQRQDMVELLSKYDEDVSTIDNKKHPKS